MRQFDHEKLTVYQTAVKFVAWADDLLAGVPKSLAVHNQKSVAAHRGRYRALPDQVHPLDR